MTAHANATSGSNVYGFLSSPLIATDASLVTPVIQGGYNGSVTSAFGNPLGSVPAWTGGGAIGILNEVRVDLSAYSGVVRIRFRFAADSGVASLGWIIDDVAVSGVSPCLSDEGLVALDAKLYACGDTIGLEVMDLNAVGSSLTVEITTTAGDTETVTLNDPETDKIYVGSIAPAASGAAVTAQNGAVEGADTDTITDTYNDADDGTGSGAVATDVASLDCAAPVVSSVTTISNLGSDVLVELDTDETAFVTIRFGTSCGSLTQSASGLGADVTHSITLSGLTVGTLYFFVVDATASAGNLTTDDNGGGCYTFTPVVPAEYFTEEFDADDFDLQYTTLRFTPDGSADYYSGCRFSATSFPTDPTGGTLGGLADRDDGRAVIFVSGGVPFYGVSETFLFAGTNGFVTHGISDSSPLFSIINNFNFRRISALGGDLDLTSQGTLSYKVLADRVAITYEDVPEKGPARLGF